MMTLSDKIITLAALDMPPLMIISELDHQYQRDVIAAAISELRRQGILMHVWSPSRGSKLVAETRHKKNARRRNRRATDPVWRAAQNAKDRARRRKWLQAAE